MTHALEIAGTSACTEAEGPGLRFGVWVQGCTLDCPGCCNPEMFVRGHGRPIGIDALDLAIAQACGRAPIEGITVLGGEPLQQIEAVTALCERMAARSLGVIVFTGYTRAEALAHRGWRRLWDAVDTFVTGRFVALQPETSRRFIGSRNQTLVHRTARYADPAMWAGVGPTGTDEVVELEIRPSPTDGRSGMSVQLVGAPRLARSVTRLL